MSRNDPAERPENTDDVLIRVRDLRKYFRTSTRLPFSRFGGESVRAVDGVTFDVHARKTLSLVGESGSGKTTTARLILRLVRPTSGRVLFAGEDVHRLRGVGLRRYRASVQAVFQDPWSSLNPRLRAGSIVAEPLIINRDQSRASRKARVAELLEAVGLDPALARHFPHEFSGGMRQRLAVARALALNPSLIIFDEPVSALDVSIRAQIMNLLKDLQARFDVAYLLIAHDLATVRYLSDRVAVMYLGEIVELAPSEELFTNPLHPYTRALLSASQLSRPGDEQEEVVLGDVMPSPTNPPSGCRFHTRCPVSILAKADDPDFHRRTVDDKPPLIEEQPGHWVACHLHPASVDIPI